MITVYGIQNCDTIKKTRNWLSEAGYPHQLHDYRKQGLSEQLLNELLNRFTLEQLINRRGTTWRQLPEASRQNLTRESARILIKENPALIKRPVISDGQDWLIGFDPEAIKRLTH